MRTSTERSSTANWCRGGVLTLAFAVFTVSAVSTVASRQAAAQFDMVAVEGREHREVLDLQGATVHGFQLTEIRAKLGGYVKSIGETNGSEVDVGSRVKKNDVLAVLDIPEMKNELTEKDAMVEQTKSAVAQADAGISEAESVVLQSKAALDQVKSRTAEKAAMLKLNETKLNRLSRLANSGTIGQDSLDEARFDVEVARAALESVKADVRAAAANIQAAEASTTKSRADKASAIAKVSVAESAVDHLKTMMNYTTIRAPYDGVITKRTVDIGSYVQPAENNSAAMPIFQLTQTSKVRIMVAVPNNKVGKIEVGQPIVFDSIGGLEGRAFAGTVTRTAGTLDLKTRTMQIEVHLDNPTTDTVSGNKVELKPGLYGTLTVVRKEWKGDSLLPVIPTTAIGKDNDGNYYVVVVEGGKPTRRKVSVAFNDAAAVGISRGLKVGEKVMRSGVSKY